MSKSLLDQLDVYGTDFETALAPTELDDVMTGSREVGFAPRTPPHRYPTFRWATAAVGAMVVVVGGVAWLLGGNPEQDVVQTTPEATDVIAVGGWLGNPLVAADGAIWVALQFESSVIRIDATTLEVTDTIPVGEAPGDMFPTEDGLWVLDNNGGGLLLVDTSTRQVTDSIEILDRGGQEVTPVLVGETLWVHTNTSAPPTRVEVDLTTRAVVSETPVGHLPWWAEAINGAIWSWAPTDGLRRFDLETRERDVFVEAYLDYTEECCIALDDAIWLVSHDQPLLRFSLRTKEVTDELDLQVGGGTPGGPLRGGIAAAGAIWLPNNGSGAIYRIDPVLRTVTDIIRVGLEPTTPIFAEGAIWVPNQGSGTVSRIDIDTRQVTDTIQVGNRPTTPLAFNGAIWVPNLEDETITRIPTGEVIDQPAVTSLPQELSVTWSEAQWTGDEQDPWISSSAAWSTRHNYAQVGDTILMIDHTHATCCGNPISGTSLWPLLASNDGVSWTEIGSLPGEDVHVLDIEAGDFFWVYGPQVGGGGGGIEITSTHTTIWVSADGLNWQPVDVEFVIAPSSHVGPGSPATRFVRASGDKIFIISGDTFEGDGGYWVGTIDTL